MTRARLPAAERRERLLDVARDVVAAEGFHAATIDRVAREAGVTRTLIYAQFGDLPGMVAALVDRETTIALRGLQQVLAPHAPGLSFVQAAVATVGSMLDATGEAPVSWRILLNPPVGGPPELHQLIAAGRELARESVNRLLTEHFPDHLRDPELSAHLVHLVGDELVRLHLNDPERYPRQRVLDQVESLYGVLGARS